MEKEEVSGTTVPGVVKGAVLATGRCYVLGAGDEARLESRRPGLCRAGIGEMQAAERTGRGGARTRLRALWSLVPEQ